MRSRRISRISPQRSVPPSSSPALDRKLISYFKPCSLPKKPIGKTSRKWPMLLSAIVSEKLTWRTSATFSTVVCRTLEKRSTPFWKTCDVCQALAIFGPSKSQSSVFELLLAFVRIAPAGSSYKLGNWTYKLLSTPARPMKLQRDSSAPFQRQRRSTHWHIRGQEHQHLVPQSVSNNDITVNVSTPANLAAAAAATTVTASMPRRKKTAPLTDTPAVDVRKSITSRPSACLVDGSRQIQKRTNSRHAI